MINTNNLRIRLLGARVFVLLLFFIGFAYSTIVSLDNAYTTSLEALLNATIKDIKHEYHKENAKPLSFAEIKDEFDIPVLYAQIVAYNSLSNQPTILARSEDLGEQSLNIPQKIIQKIFENPNEVAFFHEPNMKINDKNIYTGTFFLAQNEFQMLFLECALPYDPNTPQAQEVKKTLLFWLPCLFIAILYIANKLLSGSLSSVSAVTKYAKKMAGKMEYSVIPQSHVAREIDDLIATFNTLLNELHHAYAQVKQFGQNASHELKTPLTIIQGEIDVGLRKERTPDEYQRILKNVQQEVSHLHDVIDKILFLSSMTKNEIQSHFSEIYLDEVVLSVIEEKRPLCEQKNITLSLKALETQSIQGNTALLKIAINNILDNAIKYSPSLSTISVSLQMHQLIIQDEGIGIKEEDQKHIFEQFYRSEHHKQSDIKGSGLGLAIVKNILDLHGFAISLTSQENQGAIFTIHF